jgi:hypothetical protein
MSFVPLLPHPTPGELAAARVIDPHARLIAAFEAIVEADWNPPGMMLPYLVWQYGLGELSPYIPNLYDLIDDGVRWQRVRGTPAAVAKALGWLGYSATLEEEPTRRRRWNRLQLALDRIRDVEDPDLGRIAGAVQLSLCERSRFARGFSGYDVRACEASYGRASETLAGDHSGVTLDGIAPKWSFGRCHQVEHTLDETELTALGTWIPAGDGEDILWFGDTGLWVDDDALWFSVDMAARAAAISAALVAFATSPATVYVRFRASGGAIIGHRRATILPVAPSASGEFSFGAGRWTATTSSPTAVLAHARTDFGDGDGATAATASLVFGATRSGGAGPGTLWLGPTGLSGGHEVAASAVTIPFGRTVRDRVLMLLRF